MCGYALCITACPSSFFFFLFFFFKQELRIFRSRICLDGRSKLALIGPCWGVRRKKKWKKNSRRSTNVLLSSQEAVAKAATVARMTGVTCALLETRLPKMLNTSVLEKEVKKKRKQWVCDRSQTCVSVCGRFAKNEWFVDVSMLHQTTTYTLALRWSGFIFHFFKSVFLFFITACPLISKRSRRYCLSRLSWSINVVGERRATVFCFHVNGVSAFGLSANRR